ncbi:MAG: hypothetical protein IJ661_04945 [Lachnospiraceae bacterium]|nr:hypothetical protein [Lachnospiraceae bacterium]
MAKVIHRLQDYRHLEWSKLTHSSGMGGSILKSYRIMDNTKIYYKLSDYSSVHGFIGHECVNEILAARLMGVLGIEHLDYNLIHARVKIGNKEYKTYLCSSKDYKKEGESAISMETYYRDNHREKEEPLEFCIRMGWAQTIYKMFIVDYIILNRDRHGANVEVLYNRNTHKVRLAPLYDHGLSLVCECKKERELEEFDIMRDVKIQSFVAGCSANDNLSLVPVKIMRQIGNLDRNSESELFEGLEGIISNRYREKMWDMIWKRWQHFDRMRQ